MTWDEYFIKMIDLIASKSKDTSTKVGCVIVDKNHSIISTGYNGFPRGVDDSKKERYERPMKYSYTEHSERNAIYNAARRGNKVEECRMYVDWLPCCDCARAIIQSGIKEVIIDGRDLNKKREYWNQRWRESMIISYNMFSEAGVIIRIYQPRVVE